VDVAEIARDADAIGAEKGLVIPRDDAGGLTRPTRLVADAHGAGLAVHAWTFRAEGAYLPAGLDAAAELDAFVATGLDGIFTDHPDIAVRTLSRLGGS
jgi:glycerophosphoryl diester phosphodiesterase